MARISSYGQDGTLNKLDKVIGTDSATGATKNYSIDSVLGLVNEEDLVDRPDGGSFAFKSYEAGSTNPQGIINLNAGSATQAAFSAVNQIYISVLDKSGLSVAEYLDNANDDFIKISKRDNINQFGIYEVTAVVDHDGGAYKKLTVTPRGTNGNINPNDEYFVSNYSALYDQDFSDDSVTEFSDVTNAGSGQIITSAERTSLTNFTNNGLVNADVVNNVTSTAVDVPLSAAQGKVLKDLIDAINTLLTSDNTDLDSLQEIVDYIETNRTDLDNLGISNITGLQAALDLKQNTEAGKGLSANDFTTILKTKLDSIAENAEVNVNADWTASTGDAQILNKPTDLTNLSIHDVTELRDVTSAGSGAIITSAERTKLTGIETGAEVNVQADWNESDSASDAFIQNKPTLAPSNAEQNVQADFSVTDTNSDAFIANKPSITVQGTVNEVEVSPSGAQLLDQNRTFTVGLPNDVTIGEDLKVNETIELVNAQTSTPTFDNGIYYSTEDNHDTLHFRYDGHDLSIDYLTENIPTGILNGGELSTNTNTTFDIAAGDGIINILNKGVGTDPHPEIKKVIWSATTVTHTLGDANNADQLNTWIYVDQNGAIQQTLSELTPAVWRSNIVLGAVIHSSNVIRFVRTFPRTAYSAGNTYAEFVEIFGPLKKSGHLLTVNSTNALAFDRSAGEAFALGRNYVTDPLNPSLVSDGASTPVFHRYSSTATGFTKDNGTGGAGFTSIDPSKYDNNGTLTNMSAGQYSVQRLYHFPNNTNVIVAYYGKAEYASIDEAEKNYLLENFQEANNTATQAIFLGALIVKGNATDLSNSSQAKILTGGIFRSLSATNLGGVAADSSLNDLTDVTITSPTNGQVVKYNSTTGQFENQADASGIQLTDLSVGTEGTASGDGDVSYNNTTGVFTYTPPDLSSYLTAAIDGTGTPGVLPKMSDSDTITDSVISESGQVVNIDTTGAVRIPDGATGDRPTGVAGMFRFNTTDSKFEGYDGTDWGEIGGSAGASAFSHMQGVGDGSTTSFALGNTPSSHDQVMVYLEGVYQEKATYSISGSNIVFNTAPPNGYSIEVKYLTGVLNLTDVGEVILDELAGDGTATYALSATPQSENYTNVYIEGVYQEKGTYSVSGANITFSSNVPTGYSIEVSTMRTIPAGSVTQTTFVTDTFTANGSTNNFTLVNGSPSSKSLTMVFIQGVYQAKSNYNLVSGQIQFGSTPSIDDVIEVISISAANTAGSPVTSVNGEVGAVSVVSKHNVSVISANATAVANTLYVFTANLNLTLPASPAMGDSIKISNRSGVATCQLLRNGNNILGAAADLTLNTASASFELVYTDTANGWVIIGQ